MTNNDNFGMGANGRLKYSYADNDKMWRFLYRQLKQSNPDALMPKGLAIWKLAERERVTCKSYQSMQTHFRRQLLDSILTAPLRNEQIRYLVKKLRKCFPPENYEMMLQMLDEPRQQEISVTSRSRAMQRIAQHPSGVTRTVRIDDDENADEPAVVEPSVTTRTISDNGVVEESLVDENSAVPPPLSVDDSAAADVMQSNTDQAECSQHKNSDSATKKQKRKHFLRQKVVFSKLPRIAEDETENQVVTDQQPDTSVVDETINTSAAVDSERDCFPELYFESASDSYAYEWDLYRYRMCDIIDSNQVDGEKTSITEREAEILLKESEEVLHLSRKYGLSFHRVLLMITNNEEIFSDRNTLIRTLDAVRRSHDGQTKQVLTAGDSVKTNEKSTSTEEIDA